MVILGLAAALTLGLLFLAFRWWRRRRVSPEERERRRRQWLAASGKMGDANLLEIRGELLLYSYAVRGVEYTSSQDVSHLSHQLPADMSEMGPVAVKYDPRNPANSIVLAEEWTGLRARKAG